jgi:K+-transporting ATPase ATPase B chain
VAKYFAIIPAMFAARSRSDALNIMGLQTPQSAILSAVIFNALIIVAWCRWRCEGSVSTRRRRRAA